MSFEHTAEQFYAVGLTARSGDSTLSGASAVEFMLDEIHVDLDAWRHTVNDTSHALAMAFAKSGKGENIAKGVAHS